MTNQYEPWKELGITELEYWQRRFLEMSAENGKLESQNQIYKTALEYAISKASGDVKNALNEALKSGGES